LIDITFLEEKDAKLKFSRIEAPPKKLVYEIGGWLKRSHGNLELSR
jgi:hypothetical protein